MPKINKDTLKTLKNGVKVFKYENKNSYNCYFQVGSTYAKSGKKYYGVRSLLAAYLGVYIFMKF